MKSSFDKNINHQLRNQKQNDDRKSEILAEKKNLFMNEPKGERKFFPIAIN